MREKGQSIANEAFVYAIAAYGLLIQSGGMVDEVIINRGGIVTEGDNVISLQA
jgi:hypothetical protein